MTYEDIFQKVDENFHLSFDIEELLDGEGNVETTFDPLADERGSHRFYKNPEGTFKWQHFPIIGATISVHFAKNFPKEAEEIVSKLKILKEKILASDLKGYSVEKLRKHEIQPEFITIFKMDPDRVLDPHTDNARTATINIGLKNSNTHSVLVGRTISILSWKTNHKSFVVEDGHAYLLDVRYMHSVVPREENTEKKTRYILSYNLDEIPDKK